MSAAKKVKCPDCSLSFTTVQIMSMHRRNVHGVIGTSKSSLQLREKRQREAATSSATPLPGQALTSFACDQCEKAFGSFNGLAKHQSKIHGIIGASKSAQDRHKLKLKKLAAKVPPPTDPPPQPLSHACTQCSFVAKTKAGLSIHLTTTHKRSTALAPTEEAHQLTPATPTGQAHGEAHRNGVIPEATLALALGRFQGLCQSMAFEFDLPQRSFATRLAELIYHATLR